MNTQQEEAYIEGFVKRANEYGFNDEEAFEILKEAARGKRRNFAGYDWISPLKEDLKELPGQITERLKERGGELKETLKEKVREGVSSNKDKLKDIASKGLKELRRVRK